MEGPTPVSALIHAATMVAAGVFLVGRTYPIFVVSGALPVVAFIGAFTALFAALIAVGAVRHQAHPGLLDALAARLYGRGAGHRRLGRRRCSTC